MNKNRRKAIADIVTKVEEIVSDAKEKLEMLQSDIEDVRDEEQEYMDNMPCNLFNSERYERAEEAFNNLDYAASSIEEIIDALDCEDLIGYLNDAAE